MLYLSQDSHQGLYAFIQTKCTWHCFKCFLVYFILTKVLRVHNRELYLLKIQFFSIFIE